MGLTDAESQALFVGPRCPLCTTVFANRHRGRWFLARRSFPGKWIAMRWCSFRWCCRRSYPDFPAALFGTQGPIGGWLLATVGIVIAFTWKRGPRVAVMAFPLMVQPVRLAFRLIDIRLEQAATTLGATPWRAFLTITLPLAFPGIIAGSMFCFSRSLSEFGATMAFVGTFRRN
jgi:molybdate transport system permease protein